MEVVSDKLLDLNKVSEIDLFSDFYKLQNNIELDDNRRKIVNDIINYINNRND